jgi:hypothetical protein
MGSHLDPDTKRGEEETAALPALAGDIQQDSDSVSTKDDAILPAGVLDPVYDAKARVLNHAVST